MPSGIGKTNNHLKYAMILHGNGRGAVSAPFMSGMDLDCLFGLGDPTPTQFHFKYIVF